MGSVTGPRSTDDESLEHTSTGGTDIEPSSATTSPSTADDDVHEAKLARDFAEFQRFRQFQHWEKGQHGENDPHSDHDLHGQLRGMQSQLSELTESSRRVERATNPPMWKRVMRSGWLRWLAGLVIIVVVAALTYDHFFGEHDSGDPSAALPGERPQVQQRVGMNSPRDAVAQIYRDVASAAMNPAEAQGYAQNACLIFTEHAAAQFGDQHGADCERAIASIDLTDPSSYTETSLGGLPPLPANVRSTVIDSCALKIRGGPALGTFTLTVADGDKWLVTEVSPARC